MQTDHLILIEHIVTSHSIESDFIDSLQDFGLIEIVVIEDNKYLAHEQLKDMEKLIRLHYELGINLEGIDAITHLQKRIDDLQAALNETRNRLRLFE